MKSPLVGEVFKGSKRVRDIQADVQSALNSEINRESYLRQIHQKLGDLATALDEHAMAFGWEVQR